MPDAYEHDDAMPIELQPLHEELVADGKSVRAQMPATQRLIHFAAQLPAQQRDTTLRYTKIPTGGGYQMDTADDANSPDVAILPALQQHTQLPRLGRISRVALIAATLLMVVLTSVFYLHWQQRQSYHKPATAITATQLVYVSAFHNESGNTDTMNGTASLYALTKSNRRVVWQFHLANMAGALTFVVNDEVLFVITSRAQSSSYGLIALDARTGATRWQMALAEMVALPIQVKNGTVIFGVHDNLHTSIKQNSSLTAVRLSDGKELWQTTFTQNTIVPATLTDDTVYASAYTPCIFCAYNQIVLQSTIAAIDTRNGSIRWQRESSNGSLIFDPHSPVYVRDNTLFASAFNGASFDQTTQEHVVALDTTSGQIRWQAAGQLTLMSADTLYAFTSIGLEALSPNTGNLLWQVPVAGDYLNSVVLVDSVVCLDSQTTSGNHTSAGAIYGVDAKSGAMLWKMITTDIPQQIVGVKSSLYVQLTSSAPVSFTIIALDVHSGQQRWTTGANAEDQLLNYTLLDYAVPNLVLATDGSQIYQLTANTFAAWATSDGHPSWSFTAYGTFREMMPHQ